MVWPAGQPWPGLIPTVNAAGWGRELNQPPDKRAECNRSRGANILRRRQLPESQMPWTRQRMSDQRRLGSRPNTVIRQDKKLFEFSCQRTSKAPGHRISMESATRISSLLLETCDTEHAAATKLQCFLRSSKRVHRTQRYTNVAASPSYFNLMQGGSFIVGSFCRSCTILYLYRRKTRNVKQTKSSMKWHDNIKWEEVQRKFKPNFEVECPAESFW